MSKHGPSPAMVVAMIALCLGVGGSAIAAGGLTKSKVKQISSKQANKVLTQREASLSVSHAKTATSADDAKTATTATTAATASEAARLGGIGPAGYQRFCEAGSIKGSAVVTVSSATSATYTPVAGFNCAQPGNTTTSVEIRRNGSGNYNIKFLGLTSSGTVMTTPNTLDTTITQSDFVAPGEFVIRTNVDTTPLKFTVIAL